MKKLMYFMFCFIFLFFTLSKKNENNTEQQLSMNIVSEFQSLDPRIVRNLNSSNLDYINLLNKSEKILNIKQRKKAKGLLLDQISIYYLTQDYLKKENLEDVYPCRYIDLKYAYFK